MTDYKEEYKLKKCCRLLEYKNEITVSDYIVVIVVAHISKLKGVAEMKNT